MRMKVTQEARTSKAIIISLFALLAFATYAYYGANTDRKELSENLDGARTQLKEKEIENEGLLERLEDETQNADLLSDRLKELTGTVGILEKLQSTDEELLQKYSKVYFLNEHYTPERLRTISSQYVARPEEETERVHAQVWPHLKDLLEEAAKDDTELKVVSAYRSFEEQSELKGRYTFLYGSGANTFSADQGYSEHQLGTTLDFNTPSMGAGLDGFESTQAFSWLKDHAHEYGFVLSYPQGNSYYVFEPWHWRYVGVKRATELEEKGKGFYDIEQRKIDEYLIYLFD